MSKRNAYFVYSMGSRWLAGEFGSKGYPGSRLERHRRFTVANCLCFGVISVYLWYIGVEECSTTRKSCPKNTKS